MRYSYFVGAAADEWCLIIIITYFGTLYMINSPVFGFVITQHATIRSHARTNYSEIYVPKFCRGHYRLSFPVLCLLFRPEIRKAATII